MKVELEAKFLDIDKEGLRAKLQSIGAVCTNPERIMRRVIFENDYLRDKRAWLRIRSEGDVIKLTLKQATNAIDISRIKEAEVVVGDFSQMKDILIELGLEEKRYQENYRESWKCQGVSIDLDTWPGIPPYVEIEGESEDAVRHISAMLGFDFARAVFGSADEVFKNVYGIDILSIDKLVF